MISGLDLSSAVSVLLLGGSSSPRVVVPFFRAAQDPYVCLVLKHSEFHRTGLKISLGAPSHPGKRDVVAKTRPGDVVIPVTEGSKSAPRVHHPVHTRPQPCCPLAEAPARLGDSAEGTHRLSPAWLRSSRECRKCFLPSCPSPGVSPSPHTRAPSPYPCQACSTELPRPGYPRKAPHHQKIRAAGLEGTGGKASAVPRMGCGERETRGGWRDGDRASSAPVPVTGPRDRSMAGPGRDLWGAPGLSPCSAPRSRRHGHACGGV